MTTRRGRKAVTLVATLSLLCAFAVAWCPTCVPVAQAMAPAAGDGCCDGAPFESWQGPEEGCACCETQSCTEGDELPDGRVTRSVPVPTPAVAGLTTPVALPAAPSAGQPLPRVLWPPGPPELHILHASFRC